MEATKNYKKHIYEYSTKKTFIGSMELNEAPSSYKIGTPEKMANLAKFIGLAEELQEVLIAVLLGTKNELIGFSTVSRGLLDRCHCHSRTVFREAIIKNAAKIVLLHNHPSGDVKPSAADLSVTKALVRAGRIIDIDIVDHIIVGQEQEFKFYSMRTEKDLN